MKFIHLSDLHLGKKVNEFSMFEDQKYILSQVLDAVKLQNPDAVLIAGDIYDKSVPPVEAVELFDTFLVSLSKLNTLVFIISGNHDSPERLAFGARLMESGGIYISDVYNGTPQCNTLSDEFGNVNIYMLPFIKPAHVRRFFEDDNTDTYTDALRTAISHMEIPDDERNVLITHQFVTGSIRCESEEVSVGGSDNVDVSVFDAFDYVALGHIHGPQSAGRETVRYSGTPLKYSFSEVSHKKSITVVELKEKGSVVIDTIPLIPKRDMKELRGSYDELTYKGFYENINTDDYMHITLTDEEDIPDVISKLRIIYPNIMRIDYDNKRTALSNSVEGADMAVQKTPLQYFAEFYELQNNQPMSDIQTEFVQKLFEDIGEKI